MVQYFPSERRDLLALVGGALRGKMTLIAGCSAYSSAEVAAHAELAARSGFDGILVTPPPYMVPTDQEILEFYREVNEAVELPMCVYNWPPGTNVDMSLSLLQRIAELSKVVAIKHSTADLLALPRCVLRARKTRFVCSAMPDERPGHFVGQAPWPCGRARWVRGAVLGRELPGYFDAIWADDLPRASDVRAAPMKLLMREWFNTDYTGPASGRLRPDLSRLRSNELGLPGGYPRRPLLPLDVQGVSAVRSTLVKLGKI